MFFHFLYLNATNLISNNKNNDDNNNNNNNNNNMEWRYEKS